MAADPSTADTPPLLTPYTDFPYAVIPMPADLLAQADGVEGLQNLPVPNDAEGARYEP
jgi:hypothetical protein